MLQLNIFHKAARQVKASGKSAIAITVLFVVSTSSALAALPSIGEFTSDMIKKDGLIPVYYDDESDKVYLAVPTDHAEYLFQSSLPYGVGSNDIGLDRGQLGNTRLVSFEKFGNKVLLKQHNTKYRAAHGSDAEKQSIDEAFADSVIAGFTLVAKTTAPVL